MDDNVDKWVEQFIQLRDARKALKDVFEKKDAELKGLMDERAGRLQAFLDNSGLEKASTKAGTVYTTTAYSASLSDPNAFMEFVIAHNRFDLLDRRANKVAVKEYVQSTNELPPGCNLNAIKTVGVRRANTKE